VPERYDLAVIGSGPAGQKAAICAAKLRKRVVVVDREDRIGGVSLHTGTIPSKTLREAVLYLSGFRQRAFYGRDYRLKEKVAASDLHRRVDPVKRNEMEIVRAQLKRNDVETIHGAARFADANTLVVEAPGGTTSRVEADRILVACGTRPAEHATVPIDVRELIAVESSTAISSRTSRTSRATSSWWAAASSGSSTRRCSRRSAARSRSSTRAGASSTSSTRRSSTRSRTTCDATA
jgi:pyruvate/2-oxoglutarate dehydrogenase complex dihydrolipoamide dehydrogenase (E3) component